MRLAILIPMVGNAFGQEKVLQDACRSLREAGVKILIVAEECFGPPPAVDAFEIVHPLTGFHSFTPRGIRGPSQQKVLQALERFSPDVVHFYDQLDFRLMRAVREKYPVVFTAHTVSPTCPSSNRLVQTEPFCTAKSGYGCVSHSHKQKCLGFLKTDIHKAHAVFEFRRRRKELEVFDRVIAISEYVYQLLIRDGFERLRVSKIYNPVVVDSTLSESVLPKRSHIVCAARLVKLKGLVPLLHAVAGMTTKDATLSVVGEGDELLSLRNLSKELGISAQVEFVGKKTYRETQAILASAAVVVQPNLGPEGFGLTIAEAGALGRPTVAFAVPALDEIIQHEETGLLVPAGDIRMLSAALERLISDPELSDSMGRAARRMIHERFSLKNHCAALIAVYEASVSHKRTAAR